MVQNFFAWLLTGIVVGLILFGIYKLIRYLIDKKKKKDINDDNVIDIK